MFSPSTVFHSLSFIFTRFPSVLPGREREADEGTAVASLQHPLLPIIAHISPILSSFCLLVLFFLVKILRQFCKLAPPPSLHNPICLRFQLHLSLTFPFSSLTFFRESFSVVSTKCCHPLESFGGGGGIFSFLHHSFSPCVSVCVFVDLS